MIKKNPIESFTDKVVVAEVIMSDQPVYWAHWFAKFVSVLVLPSCFWHCYRNW